MSKVEFFYWNKLSNNSFSFESDQLSDLCFVSAIQGGCTYNIEYIYHCCVLSQKEFSRKVELSKVEFFTGINSAIKAFL